MHAANYDPRDVLEKYVSTISRPTAAIVRDASELTHPKDVIKGVLQHCIRTIDEAEKRDFLRNAYLMLGNFQHLTEEERRAVAMLNSVGSPSAEGSEQFNRQARRLNRVAQPLQVVMDKLKADLAILAQELKSLPGAH
jgi:hypothetical protein